MKSSADMPIVLISFWSNSGPGIGQIFLLISNRNKKFLTIGVRVEVVLFLGCDVGVRLTRVWNAIPTSRPELEWLLQFDFALPDAISQALAIILQQRDLMSLLVIVPFK